MSDVTTAVERIFNKGSIVALCEREFETLKKGLQDNIRKKRKNSGNDMNAFGAPASTTGGTEQSMSTVVTESPDGFSIAFMGASHLGALDKGKSPEELHQEFGSREELNKAIRAWAKRKYERYGRGFTPDKKGIDIWNNGTTLYQQGGGTEVVRIEVDAAIERINEQLTELLDKSIYELLNTEINL